jgi:hypothetical protein
VGVADSSRKVASSALGLVALVSSSLAVWMFLAFAVAAPLPLAWQASFLRGRLQFAAQLTDPSTGDPILDTNRLRVVKFLSYPRDPVAEQRLWWEALGHRDEQAAIVATSPDRVVELTKLGFRSLPWEPLVMVVTASPTQDETMVLAVVSEDEPTVPNRLY